MAYLTQHLLAYDDDSTTQISLVFMNVMLYPHWTIIPMTKTLLFLVWNRFLSL